ncbi:MAG: type II toxin-antitoxin system RelE/ParE family toxin [Carbonactinosporaceae bacterium]
MHDQDDATYDQIIAALRVLEDEGPSLGTPLVKTLKGSRLRNLKELWPGSVGRSDADPVLLRPG